jgi:hypothetical protein
MGRSAVARKVSPPQQPLFGDASPTLPSPPPAERLAYLFQEGVLGRPPAPCSGTRATLRRCHDDSHRVKIAHENAFEGGNPRRLHGLQSAADVYSALVDYWHAAVKPDSKVLYPEADGLREISWADFTIYSRYSERGTDAVEGKWRNLAYAMLCGQKTHPVAAIIPLHQGIQVEEADGQSVYEMPLSNALTPANTDPTNVTFRLIVPTEWGIKPTENTDILFVGFPAVQWDDAGDTQILLVPHSPDMVRLIGARSLQPAVPF